MTQSAARLVAIPYRIAARSNFLLTRKLYHRVGARFAGLDLVRARRLGLVIELDLRDNVQRQVFFLGTYEPDLVRAIREAVGSDGVYLDVGAHIGIHALSVALHAPHGSVIAVEAAPDSAAKIARTARSCGIRNVSVVAKAAGPECGEIVIYGDPVFHEQDVSVRSAFTAGSALFTAPVVPLDDELSYLERLDVVKVDIQGSELDALRGMASLLTRLRPKLVIVEEDDTMLRLAGIGPDDIRQFMSGLGYGRYDLWDGQNVGYRFQRENVVKNA